MGITREAFHNQKSNDFMFGSLLRALDRQDAWHKADDQANMVFYQNRPSNASTPYATGTHSPYPFSLSTQEAVHEYLNALKAAYNLHLASTAAHDNADTVNVLTSAASTSLLTAVQLVAEFITDFPAHCLAGASSLTGAHTHTVPSHTHALHLNNADVVDGATTRINAGANLLGANTGADIAVAGVADTSGAGGIVAVAAGVTGSGGGAVSTAIHLQIDRARGNLLFPVPVTWQNLFDNVPKYIAAFRDHLYLGPLRTAEEMGIPKTPSYL